MLRRIWKLLGLLDKKHSDLLDSSRIGWHTARVSQQEIDEWTVGNNSSSDSDGDGYVRSACCDVG